MEKNKCLARLALIEQTIAELPVELETLSIYPENHLGGEPEVFVHESVYTAPKMFRSYAATIGAKITRINGITEKSDALQFYTKTGVKVQCFVDRGAANDKGREEAQ